MWTTQGRGNLCCIEAGGSVREKKIGSVVEKRNDYFSFSPLGAFLFSLPSTLRHRGIGLTERRTVLRTVPYPARFGRVRLNAIFEISAAHATNASASTKKSLRKYLGPQPWYRDP
ncbi:hypothetical protein Trihar35433_10053 [Trichoderma harzianum]|nr:hypothetical protein Trihar35433_10053 [Trichoderma harzianum]